MIDDPPISDLLDLSSVGEATFVRVVFGVFPLLRMFQSRFMHVKAENRKNAGEKDVFMETPRSPEQRRRIESFL
jgi:hypothetical protein